MILGHAHPQVVKTIRDAVKKGTGFGTATRLETELARLITEAVPSIQQVRLTNSGTEAVMGAVRLARAITRRKKIIMFEGAYHGHADYLLAKAGSGQATLGIARSPGVPEEFTRLTLVLPFNNLQKVEETARKYRNDLAAILVKPVLANCGVILPAPGFLEGLRRVADKYRAILIFDEVITGFRLSYGGAQEYFKVEPDLTCLGKIIGGGLPVGAFGGKKEMMRSLAPLGNVYQAGTLAGNPVAVTGGIATLKILKKENPYHLLKQRTERFCERIKERALARQLKLSVHYTGSLFSIFFTGHDVKDYASARTQDVGRFKRFFHSLLRKGVYLSPSAFETNFMSLAHTRGDLNRTIEIIDLSFKETGR